MHQCALEVTERIRNDFLTGIQDTYLLSKSLYMNFSFYSTTSIKAEEQKQFWLKRFRPRLL